MNDYNELLKHVQEVHKTFNIYLLLINGIVLDFSAAHGLEKC